MTPESLIGAFELIDRFAVMVRHLAGEPLPPLEPARPVNGLRHAVFTRQAGTESETRVIWRIVRGKPVKVDPPAPKSSNGKGFG